MGLPYPKVAGEDSLLRNAIDRNMEPPPPVDISFLFSAEPRLSLIRLKRLWFEMVLLFFYVWLYISFQGPIYGYPDSKSVGPF